MKNKVLSFILIAFCIYIFGCQKNEVVSDGLPEPMPIETLGADDGQGRQDMAEVMPDMQLVQPLSEVAPKLDSLPPSGPYKPVPKEIQSALKNAGYYSGRIDGKIGPVSKKAIEAFQKAKGLKADGKVGPKTWAVLSGYLPAADN
ncbi:MAG: peptidoglycan-binding protein [Candidatus Omnitrophica bacterium]|nr:peptidoglycan-binding protein [Candidatus Omnitrophota bacterium]